MGLHVYYNRYGGTFSPNFAALPAAVALEHITQSLTSTHTDKILSLLLQD